MLITLACNSKQKANKNSSSSTTLQEQSQKESLTSVENYIKEDFNIQSISPSHPNTNNINYFRALDGVSIFDTDFNTNPAYVERIKSLTNNHYNDIKFINENMVTSPISIKNNFLAFSAGEAHNVGYNNYKILYDLDKDIFAITHKVYDFDKEKTNIFLFIEKRNLYTENQFFTLYNWAKEKS